MKYIDSYKELPIGKYINILKILRQGGDELTTQVKVLSILTDFTEEQLLHLPVVEYKALTSFTAFLGKPCEPAPKTPYSLTLEGTRLICTSAHKITTAQYIDFQTYVQDDLAVTELLSVFLIPEGKQYNEGYDIIEVQRIIRNNLCVPDALALASFFLKASGQSTATSRSSLARASQLIKVMLKPRKGLKS